MTVPAATTTHDADLVIVGGGLAGLSLACHLIEAGLGERRLLVLETRRTYCHDRYWCSWGEPDHPFVGCISHTWSRWSVATHAGSHVQQCAAQPYRCIPSGALYAEAMRRIEAHPNATLRLGCQVADVRDAGANAEIELTTGEMLHCDQVFDSRMPRAASTADGEIDWVQDFLGWRVRYEAASFDPTTVTLMQFAVGRDDVRFVYVLPFSTHEAMVESTVFGPQVLSDDEHEAVLRCHLEQSLPGQGHVILETERGRVPMSTRRRQTVSAGSRILPIGTAAGLVKPSTGYSFEAVQRWSRAVARDVAAGRTVPSPPARGRRALAMDRMFLSFLSRYPERMPALFLRMFERVAPDVLVRFLSDRASLRDAAQVAAALPMLPMLGEAVRSFRLWARSA